MEMHDRQVIYALRQYLIFASILVIGTLFIAHILENVIGVSRIVVLLFVTAWAFLAWILMIVLEDRL